MKIFLFITVALFLLIGQNATAQSVKIDSLTLALDENNQDSNYINTLNKLIGEIRYYDGLKALELCDRGLIISKQIGFEKGLMLMHYNKGVAYYSTGDYSKAIDPMKMALENAESLGRNNVVSACYNVLGVLYQNLNQTDEALNYLFKSLQLGEQMKDSFGILDACVNIGTQYYEKFNMKLAFSFLDRAEKLGLRLKDSLTLFTVYINLSNVASTDSSKLSYLQHAARCSESISDPYNLSTLNQSFGTYYLNNKENQKAYDYFKRSFYQAKLINNLYLVSVRGNNMGVTLMHLNQYDSAKYYLDYSLKLAEDNEYYEVLSNSYFYLSKWHKDQKDFKRSLEYLELENTIRDTLFNGEITEKLSDANAKYQTAEKAKEIVSQQLEIERQKNKNDRLLLGSILALLLASTVFVWYNSRNKRKKREAEIALKIEHAEMIKLREVDEMKTQFFTNISHELRTPLTLIIDPLENALENMGSIESSKKIRLAHSNSKKLLGLVNKIMDLSKLESGKLQLSTKSIELNPLIKRMFFAFESLAKIREIELVLNNHNEEGVYINIDVDKFEKILNNLCSNAIKFSPKEGVITMKVLEKGDSLTIAVKDEGIGIKKDELDKVFDRFYQSNNQGQSLQGGTGVGLALSKQLAMLFGGDLTVQSELNHGSTFTLNIPKLGWHIKDIIEAPDVIEDGTSPMHHEYIPLTINGDLPRVLIVEDNQEMSQYLKDLLSSNYNCTIANDGMEALRLVQIKAFDLITSDVMMPHMDGFKFREKVYAISSLRQIPFIFLTARALEEDKLFGLQLGVDDFITKPFNAKELKARIHNLLSNKIAREEWLKEHTDQKDNTKINDDSETQLLKEAEKIVFKNIANVDFKVSDLAQHLNYGERQLRRIIKKLTGLSPVNFILEIRLQKAYQLLERRQFLTVSEVRYEIGIDSASYFATKFKQRFGRSPKEVLG